MISLHSLGAGHMSKYAFYTYVYVLIQWNITIAS